MLPFILGDRCTTVAYFGDEEIENLQRRARDPVTGETYLVGNISYEEWRKQIDSKYGKNTLSKYHKMYNNTNADKWQYNRYKNVLGKERTPSTFAKFQDLKYNNIESYSDLKYTYNLKNHYDLAIEKGDLTPLVDFDTYINIDKSIQNELVGLSTTNGIKIKSYSKHFVDRVCGSIEQRRSGVEIGNIKNVLIHSDNYKVLEKSIVIYGNDIQVSINPQTGNLIQTNPRSRRNKNDKN